LRKSTASKSTARRSTARRGPTTQKTAAQEATATGHQDPGGIEAQEGTPYGVTNTVMVQDAIVDDMVELPKDGGEDGRKNSTNGKYRHFETHLVHLCPSSFLPLLLLLSVERVHDNVLEYIENEN